MFDFFGCGIVKGCVLVIFRYYVLVMLLNVVILNSDLMILN